jgi:hypothetical protein
MFRGSDPGAPMPVLCADEYRGCVLAYYCPARDVVDGLDHVIVTLTARAHYFGGPNDEALQGHPLYARGLRSYGIFEIENSSWIRTLEARNRVHPYHDPQHFLHLKHFVFTFHDSLFEAVLSDIHRTRWGGDRNDLFSEMTQRLLDLRQPS